MAVYKLQRSCVDISSTNDDRAGTVGFDCCGGGGTEIGQCELLTIGSGMNLDGVTGGNVR